MITDEDEYFLRASILLLKGGRLMSKETLYKELQKVGGNLDALLRPHERKFKHKFVKKQREKLFPDVEVTDVETWDLAMLTTVSLTVFKQSLNDTEKNAFRSIKSMRDEIYACSYSSSLSANQYEEIRTELQNALTSLSNGLSENLRDHCFKIIQECTTGPISSPLKPELTKQIEDTEYLLQAVMNKLGNQSEFLCEMRNGENSEKVSQAAVENNASSLKDIRADQLIKGDGQPDENLGGVMCGPVLDLAEPPTVFSKLRQTNKTKDVKSETEQSEEAVQKVLKGCIAHFLEVTDTDDSKLARYYVQKANMDVSHAISLYYEDIG